MKKILVTGANGYIGKAIINKFHHTHEVNTITRRDVDLTDPIQVDDYFKYYRFDVVIHCAVQGGNRLMSENYSVMDNNLIMYYNLLRNKNNFNKFIHIGSGAEFSQQLTPYGLSKKVISKSMSDIENFYNLRVFAVFDENELDRRFIKSSIINYIEKKPMLIHNDKKMDFFYMSDFLKILERYINDNNLPKNIDCVYRDKHKLSDIANIINSLDSHVVNININENKIIDDYVGEFFDIGLDFYGLENGITNMFNNLKNKYEL